MKVRVRVTLSDNEDMNENHEIKKNKSNCNNDNNI